MKVKLRHILIKVKPSEESIKSTIDKLLYLKEEINLKKSTFSELANLYSEDPGSKDKGGELGWVRRGSLVKNFENKAFTLNIGEISDPIETEFGFHILETLDKKGEKVKVRHILIKPPIVQKDIELVYNHLKGLKTNKIKSKDDFIDIVKQYCEDEETKKVNGDLGWIIPDNFYIKEIGQVIKYLDIDTCSDPIHSSLGIHLLWLEKVKEGGFLNLIDHYSEIEALALNYKKMTWFNKWINEAKTNFYIYKQGY